MEIKNVVNATQAQGWLKSIDEPVQNVVKKLFMRGGSTGTEVRDLLHGTWLGHPLHPVLTDLPIGAWSAAAALDVLEMMSGDERAGAAADAAVGFGALTAIGTAVTGLNDWQHVTLAKPRRIGLLHGLFNAGALTLYTMSWLARRGGNRTSGHLFGFLGLSAVTVGAYLGGDLVYTHRVGIDRSTTQTQPTEWTKVMAEADLPERKLTPGSAGPFKVVLLKSNGRIYALSDECAHLSCPLHQGKLTDLNVTCPCHGSTYSFEDGHVIHGPATTPQASLETRIQDGQIEVRIAG